jgi:hypothetical protein
VVDDVSLTRSVYAAIGEELAAVGVTLDMAPAVDVNSSDDNPTIGTRSFGTDPQRVAVHAAAAVTGLQATGVSACAKHFPGHGATEADSHFDLPIVDASMELLWSRELPPFQAAIAAGVRSVMTAHIRVPVLTGDLPATFSPQALIGLLRKELGFGGAIVSDGLEMQGASGAIGVPEAAVRALIAGNDLLCFGGELVNVPGSVAESLIEATATAIVASVREGRLTEERLVEAAARNTFLGLTPVGDRVATPPDLGLVAARRALRVEGSLPSRPRSSCSSSRRRRSRSARCPGACRRSSTACRRCGWARPRPRSWPRRWRWARSVSRWSSSAGTPTATRGPATSCRSWPPATPRSCWWRWAGRPPGVRPAPWPTWRRTAPARANAQAVAEALAL